MLYLIWIIRKEGENCSNSSLSEVVIWRSTVAAFYMKIKLYSLLVLIILVGLLVTACNGVGNLRINVYNQEQSAIDDAYVGLYKANFKNRVDFGYTTRGQVQFKALEPGNYGLKIIKHDQTKQMQVQVKSEATNQIKVNLE